MKGITPNEKGVFEEGLEKMGFSGRHSNMELSIAHCEDGLWRYGLSGELMDRLESLCGFGFAPCAVRPGYANREDCLKEACAELRQRIKMNSDKNPLAEKELTVWINSIMYESRQMSLF
jgi:hypothetical protein